MFASCRRRLPLYIRKISGDGTKPFEIIPAAFPFARNYSHAAATATTVQQTRRFRSKVLYYLRLSRSKVNVDAVRALLSQYGFTEEDIFRTASRVPTILFVDPERILRPKLDFFAALGLRPRNLATAPLLLRRSLDKHLVPSTQFIRDIIGSDHDLRLGLSRVPRALMAGVEKNMRPAVEALRRGGLSDAAISKLLVVEMDMLMRSPDRISEIFEELKEIGVCVPDSRFLYCLRVVCSVTRGTWRQKLAVFQSFGLSEGEVLKAFKRQPKILLCTEENITKKLRFLLDELKLGISDIVARPAILCYSFEMCILPRCAVLSVLMREGKIQRDTKLVEALLGISRVFEARYVLRNADDVPDVLKAYEGKIDFEGFIQ